MQSSVICVQLGHVFEAPQQIKLLLANERMSDPPSFAGRGLTYLKERPPSVSIYFNLKIYYVQFMVLFFVYLNV